MRIFIIALVICLVCVSYMLIINDGKSGIGCHKYARWTCIFRNFGRLCSVKFRCMKATGGEDQRVKKREKERPSTRARQRDEEREKEMTYLLRPGGVACETVIHK